MLFSVGYSNYLFLFFMNSMFPAKRTKLFDFQTFRMGLLILVPRIIPPAASHAFKFDEFSHNALSKSS